MGVPHACKVKVCWHLSRQLECFQLGVHWTNDLRWMFADIRTICRSYASVFVPSVRVCILSFPHFRQHIHTNSLVCEGCYEKCRVYHIPIKIYNIMQNGKEGEKTTQWGSERLYIAHGSSSNLPNFRIPNSLYTCLSSRHGIPTAGVLTYI